MNKRGHLIMLNISYCPRKCSIEKLNWIYGFFLYEGSLTRRKCARDSFVVGAKRPAVVIISVPWPRCRGHCKCTVATLPWSL